MQLTGPLIGGALGSIGGTAVQLTTDSSPLNTGVTVSALAGNGNTVFVGLSDVTVDTGYPLAAGSEHLFPVNDASTLYVIGVTNEEVRFSGS